MIPVRCVVAVAMTFVACTGQESNRALAALLAKGDSLSARGMFDSAHAAYARALERPGVRGSADEARVLTSLGLVAWRRSDYVTARRLSDSALVLKERLGRPPGERAESHNALGLIAGDEGRLADAARLFTRAIAEFDSTGDKAGAAKASSNLGNIVLEYGRFGEARERFAAARAIGRNLGDARLERRATTNLAMLEVNAGDPRTAIALIAESRALSTRNGDAANEENALAQLALAWAALGEPGRAIAMADSALDVARRHGLREEEAEDLAVVAALYASAGDLERALREYAAARALYDSLELPIEAATVERHESVIRASRGATDEARAGTERALTRHRANDAVFESFNDLLALARIDTDAARFVSAGHWLDDAERLAATFDSPQARIAAGLARARWHDAQRRAPHTLGTLRAIDDDLRVADAQSLLDATWLRTRAHAMVGQLDSAVAAARLAAATIERTGDGLSSRALRVGYRAERHRIIADIVLTLLRVGASEDAFRIAESTRGQALRADLARAGGQAGAATPNAAALAERERLLREIDKLVATLSDMEQRPRLERGAEWPGVSAELTRRIREARTAYETLVVRQIESSGDARRQPLLGAPSVDPDEIRAVLRPGEAVIEYYATRDTLVIFALTRERLSTIVVGARLADIENRVRLVRGLVGQPGRAEASRAVLERLHAELVHPLRRAGVLDGITRLVIVPHGVLTYLPFAALRNAATRRVLIEDFTLIRLPAAGMLPALRRGATTARPSDPTVVLAPFPERLPATWTEAEALTRLVPNVPVYRGAAATEARLRQLLGARTPVHIATHAAFNAANPMFSGLALATGRGDPRDDGRFDVHEVIETPVRSAFVFLSGCETGVGLARATTFDRMEDVTTLGDAFLLAGADAVVATLWRIDDAGAAAAAEAFYRALPSRLPAEALADAQRALLRHARWSDPYYWAAYTFSGEGLAPTFE